MTRASRWELYSHPGKQCLEDLALALRTGQGPSRDYVFVSIDFEGGIGAEVKELGVSSFETKQIFHNAGRLDIYNEHFSLSRGSRKSDFSTSTKITTDTLPQVLRDLFESQQNIVLIGHGLWSREIQLMDEYGVELESLSNVVGTIDAASQPCFKGQRLVDTLRANNIPHRPGSLHCAGNDAHYTLRLILALTLKNLSHLDGTPELSNSIEAMRELIARPVSVSDVKERKEEDDWLDGDLNTDMFMDLGEEGDR
ncbi:hypothetical protein LTR09_003903 [Extremus antarcticus]|uniref:Gfd2/YDR514C-like C-terminal domain-containing protein n=1 Tax=Extremus antarcticus TaxID=702011 RepID=A0AAJ0DJK3_9PEZI|nr:hypothetical protein LTR09_003903 [Extremus antarcticus]